MSSEPNDKREGLTEEAKPPFSQILARWFPLRTEACSFFLASWLFLRLVGVTYLVAFTSLWLQIEGLAGDHGILPAREFLDLVRGSARFSGFLERFLAVPTVFWTGCGEGALHAVCALGALFSILVMIGLAVPVALLALWGLYLSLVSVCGDFLGFQWDNLLLEIGFLAMFLQPFRLRPSLARDWVPSTAILFLVRFLLFRLNFSSGVVKWRTENPSEPNVWTDLTALLYHYETQPLPTVFGWYAHQLPVWFQKTSVVVMFVIQLAVPFLLFAPRPLRLFASGALVFLQILIFITGNYCFFNVLTLALCLLLIDDRLMARILPSRLLKKGSPATHLPGNAHERPENEFPGYGGCMSAISPVEEFQTARWRRTARAILVSAAFGLLLVASLLQMGRTLRGRVEGFGPAAGFMRLIAPFRTVNTYGLFAHMTTSRPEIIVEGSRDGETWEAYEFKYKPGDLNHAPVWAQPHQPRLDWQMWFAALGSYRNNPWFVNFVYRLLQGTPEVLALLERNPFPDEPPRFVRAVMYDYHFTDFRERRETGAWWKRDNPRVYLPTVSLESFRRER